MAEEEETKASSSSSFSIRSRKRKSSEENESSGSKSCSLDNDHDHLKASKEKKKKIANWKLACYLANEYMTNGTLLGRKIIEQQHHHQDCRNGNRPLVLEVPLPDTNEEIRKQPQKEKQGIVIYSTIMEFLCSDDLHLPGIVNPTQLVAWMGLDWIGVDSNG